MVGAGRTGANVGGDRLDYGHCHQHHCHVLYTGGRVAIYCPSDVRISVDVRPFICWCG